VEKSKNKQKFKTGIVSQEMAYGSQSQQLHSIFETFKSSQLIWEEGSNSVTIFTSVLKRTINSESIEKYMNPPGE
jgi:hypothetical protein